MATNFEADISKTEHFFRISYYVFEIYVKFGVFSKKNQSHSVTITEIINWETGSYLNVQKSMFHATLRQKTC